MATQEEILEKYGRDREDKIVQLQNVLSSRLAQDAKNSSAIIEPPNVTAINTFYTPSLPTQTPLLRSTVRRSNNEVKKELAGEFQRLATSDLQNTEGSADAYVLVECQIFLRNYDPTSPESNTSLTVGGTISEQVFLRLPDSKNFSQFRPSRIPASFVFLDSFKLSSSNGSGFEQLKLKLSSLNYPIEILQLTSKFKGYYDAINEELKKRNLPPIGSIPILVYSVFELGEFNFIFPKPDGLDTPPSVPETPSVPTPPSVPETPSVPTPPSVPETPSVPDVPSTPTPPTDGKKYLSIEAVKKDDPIVKNQPTPNRILSLISIDDNQDDKYYNRDELTPIKTENVSNKQGDLPDKPLGDKNPIVVSNEKQEKDKRTEAQRLAEEADSLAKETPKEKSSAGVSGPNPKLKNGKISDQDKRKDKPDSKKEEAVVQQNGNPLAKYFLEWHKTDGVDPNGIIYRGNRNVELTKNTSITDGSVEKRYKNLFEFGTNLKKMFSGIKIESPIDIGLALNGIQIGLFNKNIPYMFGEGSEVHAAIIGSGVIDREAEGGIGNYGKNANWGNEPFWCGYFTDFVLNNNGIYKSDQDRKSIIGTNSVYSPNGYYDDSTFNYIPNVVDDDIRNLQNDIRSKNREINKNDEAIEKLKKTEKNLKTKIEKEQSKISGLGRTPPGLQRLDIEYNKVVGELRGLETLNTNLERSKQSSQSALDKKTNVLQSSIYNEGKNVAVFYRGYHIGSDNSLTPRGKELLEKIKSWPGGYIVTDTGHVEVLLHISKSGKIYTLGGNTGITLLPYKGGDSTDIIKQRANPAAITKNDLANGYQYGFKMKSSFGDWAGGNFYIVKRGVKSPYTNGIGVGLIKTETWKKYEDIVKSKKDNTVSPMAYNIMKDAFSS